MALIVDRPSPRRIGDQDACWIVLLKNGRRYRVGRHVVMRAIIRLRHGIAVLLPDGADEMRLHGPRHAEDVHIETPYRRLPYLAVGRSDPCRE